MKKDAIGSNSSKMENMASFISTLHEKLRLNLEAVATLLEGHARLFEALVKIWWVERGPFERRPGLLVITRDGHFTRLSPISVC